MMGIFHVESIRQERDGHTVCWIQKIMKLNSTIGRWPSYILDRNTLGKPFVITLTLPFLRFHRILIYFNILPKCRIYSDLFQIKNYLYDMATARGRIKHIIFNISENQRK